LVRDACAFVALRWAPTLAFAERVLPRASDLWVQASLDEKRRLQQLFFPEGIAHDGIRFNRTCVTAPLFNHLAPDQIAEEILVSPEGIDHGKARPTAEAVWLMPSGRAKSSRGEIW
jgi:hypothetical protein